MATHVDVSQATQALTVRMISMSVLKTQLCATQGPAMYVVIKQANHVLLPPPPSSPHRMNLDPTAVAVMLPTLETTVGWKLMNVNQVHVEMGEHAL